MKKLVMPILGVVLIAAGGYALARGDVSYTKDTHEANIGPVEFSIKEKETVNIPKWASVGAIVVGIALLFSGRKP